MKRCGGPELSNLERKAPQQQLAEGKADLHEIVCVESEAAARKAHAAFVGKWKSRCSGVVKSLEEAGDELFTMYRFPKQQWKNIRTTNVIEWLKRVSGRNGVSEHLVVDLVERVVPRSAARPD